MSVQLDSLIAILRDNAEELTTGNTCKSVSCSSTTCDRCPFDSSDAVNALVEELEVLQHAKA